METIIVDPPTRRQALKAWFKENAIDLGVGVVTVGLAGFGLIHQIKTRNANSEEYHDYLEDRREIDEQGLEAYKAGLPNSTFMTPISEPKDKK